MTIIDQLAREVLQSDREPTDSLRNALEQLRSLVCDGAAAEFPVDWAKVIADAVSTRHR